MNRTDLDQAIAELCRRFQWHTDVEILLVGGAAGMLTGLFAGDRVTIDCDIMSYSPQSAWTAVELLAEELGAELGFPKRWFNSDVQLRADALPEGWESRRVLIHGGRRLHVYAAGRQDLVAMKCLAGRPQDLEDVETMRPTSDDRIFVRAYLSTLASKGTHPDDIARAVREVESWK